MSSSRKLDIRRSYFEAVAQLLTDCTHPTFVESWLPHQADPPCRCTNLTLLVQLSWLNAHGPIELHKTTDSDFTL